MSGMDYFDGGVGDLDDDQRDALDQLHGWISHRIAEAHLTGDKDAADTLVSHRSTISNGLSDRAFAMQDPLPVERDEREALSDRREELTRELHDAVANKDSYRAERLDRERNELTEDLYGNGEIVGAAGRSL